MHRSTWFGAIGLLLSPLVASSQVPSPIAPGARIRITGPESDRGEPRSGTVVTAGVDTVVLRLDSGGETVALPLVDISRLDVSRGLKGHVAAGVGLGFLAGAGIGVLVGSSQCGTCGGGEGDGLAKLEEGLIWGGILGGVGMLVGGVVGASHKTERWEPVPSSFWHVSTWPAGPGSFAFVLSARF